MSGGVIRGKWLVLSDTPPQKSLPTLEVFSMFTACISEGVVVVVVGGVWGVWVGVVSTWVDVGHGG